MWGGCEGLGNLILNRPDRQRKARLQYNVKHPLACPRGPTFELQSKRQVLHIILFFNGSRNVASRRGPCSNSTRPSTVPCDYSHRAPPKEYIVLSQWWYNPRSAPTWPALGGADNEPYIRVQVQSNCWGEEGPRTVA